MGSIFEDYLSEVADVSRPLVASKLVGLSDMSPDEAEVFRAEWLEIDVARRRQVVGRLAELFEDDLELDFEDVFRVCLADDDVEVRVKAIEGLGASEARSLIDPLAAILLEDLDHRARAAAAGALGGFALLAELAKVPESDGRRIEDALLATFNNLDERVEVRSRALEAISALSRPYVEDLICRAHGSDSLEFRVSAVYAMGRNCSPRWLPGLLQELSSPEPEVRFEAVRACAELEAEEAVPRLIELIDDVDPQVHLSAIEALGQIGGGEAKEALQRCLEGEDEMLREAAEGALQEIGFWEDPSAI